MAYFQGEGANYWKDICILDLVGVLIFGRDYSGRWGVGAYYENFYSIVLFDD